jgi:hypothetical protein
MLQLSERQALCKSTASTAVANIITCHDAEPLDSAHNIIDVRSDDVATERRINVQRSSVALDPKS